MAVSDKEMKKLVRLTADVRSARKNLERATKARSAISAELFRLQDENMSGTDPTTYQQNCERMNVLRDQYQQITDGTFAYPKNGPDFGKHIYTWGFPCLSQLPGALCIASIRAYCLASILLKLV